MNPTENETGSSSLNDGMQQLNDGLLAMISNDSPTGLPKSWGIENGWQHAVRARCELWRTARTAATHTHRPSYTHDLRRMRAHARPRHLFLLLLARSRPSSSLSPTALAMAAARTARPVASRPLRCSPLAMAASQARLWPPRSLAAQSLGRCRRACRRCRPALAAGRRRRMASMVGSTAAASMPTAASAMAASAPA